MTLTFELKRVVRPDVLQNNSQSKFGNHSTGGCQDKKKTDKHRQTNTAHHPTPTDCQAWVITNYQWHHIKL